MEEHPLSDHMPKESVSEVKINNGDWNVYGLMSKSFHAPFQHGRYLGLSRDIRIDGVAQKALEVEYHFWEKADDK